MYIRQYRIPEDGISRNGGMKLDGLSCYKAVQVDENHYTIDRYSNKNTNQLNLFMEQVPKMHEGFCKLRANNSSESNDDLPKHIFYLVDGDQCGKLGSDKEPLITNAEYLKALIFESDTPESPIFRVCNDDEIETLKNVYPAHFDDPR